MDERNQIDAQAPADLQTSGGNDMFREVPFEFREGRPFRAFLAQIFPGLEPEVPTGMALGNERFAEGFDRRERMVEAEQYAQIVLDRLMQHMAYQFTDVESGHFVRAVSRLYLDADLQDKFKPANRGATGDTLIILSINHECVQQYNDAVHKRVNLPWPMVFEGHDTRLLRAVINGIGALKLSDLSRDLWKKLLSDEDLLFSIYKSHLMKKDDKGSTLDEVGEGASGPLTLFEQNSKDYDDIVAWWNAFFLEHRSSEAKFKTAIYNYYWALPSDASEERAFLDKQMGADFFGVRELELVGGV